MSRPRILLSLLLLALIAPAGCAPAGQTAPDFLEVGTSYYFFFGAGRLPRTTVTVLEARPDGWVRGIQLGRIAWVNSRASMMITVAPEDEQIDIETWEPTDQYDVQGDIDPTPQPGRGDGSGQGQRRRQ